MEAALAGAVSVGAADCFWKVSAGALSGRATTPVPLKFCAGSTAQ